MFDHVIGLTDITGRLTTALAQDRLAHAYLFHGQEGVGKRAVAYDLARAVLCPADGTDHAADAAKIEKMQHPDLLWLLPIKTGLKKEELKFAALLEARRAVAEDLYCPPLSQGNRLIDASQVKELQQRCAFRSFGGGWRVFVLQEVEYLNEKSANALLKLLEEPPPGVLFLLTSNAHEQVLPTIRSRCVGIRFPGLSADALAAQLCRRRDLPATEAALIAELSDGSLTEALRHLSEDFPEKLDLAERLLCGAFASRSVPLPLEILESMSQPEDRAGFRDVLRILLFWCRQIYRERLGGVAAVAVPDSILQLLRNRDFTLVREIMGEVENSIDLVGRNVYLFLIGSVLLARLRELNLTPEYQ